MVGPLHPPPPLLSGRTTKKRTFSCGFPYWSLCIPQLQLNYSTHYINNFFVSSNRFLQILLLNSLSLHSTSQKQYVYCLDTQNIELISVCLLFVIFLIYFSGTGYLLILLSHGYMFLKPDNSIMEKNHVQRKLEKTLMKCTRITQSQGVYLT